MFKPMALCSVALAATLSAQIVDIPYQKVVLDNGLTVLIHEDHKAPIVAVNIWYHVGSKNEKPGKTGFAHLFEHLMFGGSEQPQGPLHRRPWKSVGATDLNGTTNEDRTNYFENVPTSGDRFRSVCGIRSHGPLLNTISQEMLDLQRGVVQNEKRQGENQPYAVAEELIAKATYPAGHPYAQTVIGSMEDLNARLARGCARVVQDILRALERRAGDCRRYRRQGRRKEKAKRYFGDIPPGPPVAHQQAWIAKMTGAHRAAVAGPRSAGPDV